MRRFLPASSGLPNAFWVLCGGMLVNRLGGFVAPFLAIYLTSVRHRPVEEAGLIVALVGLGSIASGPVGGIMADRIGRRLAGCVAAVGFAHVVSATRRPGGGGP